MGADAYHEHERVVQRRAGEEGIAQRNGRVIADSIPAGAIPFLAKQRYALLASVDRQKMPWASLVTGPSGFMRADPTGSQVELTIDQLPSDEHEILYTNIRHDDRVGGLAIELASRRRLRFNGRMHEIRPGGYQVAIAEAYPNCPKYIQRRHVTGRGPQTAAGQSLQTGSTLDEPARALIANADTLFVASMNPSGGLDMSHRGGHPGFVAVHDNGDLTIPDYPGNSMFNTLGNILAHPRVGVLFINFKTSELTQISGEASIDFDVPDAQDITAGTGRMWTIKPIGFRRWTPSQGLDWEFIDASPFNPS